MRRALTAVSFLLLVLVVAAPVFAQRTTGSIVGIVKDESGAVLPGVTVSLKGEAVVGTQTTATNQEGFYRFAALPPGTYNMSFALGGFSTLNRPGIKVLVGGTGEENAALKLSQMSEEITVSGESPVVDTQSTQVSTNYDKDWVKNAPLRRFTFFDLINSAPGVNQSTSTNERSTSLGSSTTDNSYQLDGTDFTAPLTGAAWPWPNTDAIEEIEVLSLGAPAEYGNLQGAVFNVVTRQGSNSFHGDANFYYQSQDLTSDNTKDVTLPDASFADACPTEEDPNRRCPYNRDKFNDLTLQLSGPIIKDKLWFFASYQYQRDYQSPAGTEAAFPTKFEADRVFFKANYQITPKHKLMFAYHDDYYRIPGDTNALTAPSAVVVEHGHNPSPNLTYTGVLSPKTYIEARVSGFYGKDHGDPQQSDVPRVLPRYLDLDTGEITGGIYTWYDGDIWKTAASLKASHFADKFLGGSHDFRFGVQFNDGGHDYVYGYNDYIYTYGGAPAYGYTQLPFHHGGKVRSTGVWADDTYRIGQRFSLNLGLRFDHSKASIPSYPILDKNGRETGEQSASIDKLFTWDVVSPRIGFNYKLTSDGKTVIKAHYGRYYRGVVTGEFDAVSPSIPPRYLFSGTYDADNNPENLELIYDISNLRVDENFKNPYTDQFIVGFDRELFKDVGLSLNYVHKRGRRYGGWSYGGETIPTTYSDTEGVDASGKDITVYETPDPGSALLTLTNPGGMFTRFNGLTVQLTKRMSNHWQMVASLVLSKAEGRLGSSRGDTTARQAGTASDFGQNPNDFINTDGRLIEDRPVVFKTQLVYELPKGFTVGLNFMSQQGRPWARQVRVADLGLPTTILADRIDGKRRVPTRNILDLRVQKAFSLGKGVNFAIFADALNLTNDATNEGIGSRLGTSDGFGLPTDFLYPRRIMVGAKFNF